MADSTLARLGSLAERRWGLFTTAQAEAVGVTRKQLVRMTSAGVIERVSHGVYRMTGAPPQTHESIYATWLALGGATNPRTEAGIAALVAGGATAAVVHEIGDFLPDRLDFIVPARKGTRLPDVRLRSRDLTPEEVVPVNGLPTLTVERTIVDLIEIGTDTSLVADALRDAVHQGKILAPGRLAAQLHESRRHDAAQVIVEVLDRAGSKAQADRPADSSDYYTGSMSESVHRARQPLSGPSGRRVALHRDELLDVLRRHGVTNPEIFGSTARGDDREDSDLDLLVDFAPGTDLIDMVNIKAELESILGTSVDLIPRDGLKERVRAAAVRDLVPL